ncbi:hypothetical protein [Metabacillus bambusae]|uniref:Pilus assembly protein PilO n=1 Tax=Metabacillus bambusae TaxID=2795218 RepID=A0ABS3N8Z1_9BACI|nr:hypothetical protein [Metabacillus bambusae]MBO1514762.1 hypothetical protein [Metabacillus bambusae]
MKTMKIQLHKKHIILLISFIVFISLLYMGGYFLYLKPIKESASSIDDSVTMLQKQLDQLTIPNEEKPVSNTFSLQQKVPITPLVDQFVLDLEKAEIISNSTIQLIEFTEGGILIDTEAEANQGIITEEIDAVVEQGTQEEVVEIPGAPEGLEQLTITVTVRSDNFYDLKKFVETIEQQTRITMVNQLSFQGPPEVTQSDQVMNPLEYKVHLTAFYMPTLTDLEAETPSIKAPQPSKKHNPLSPYIQEGNDE